VGTVMSLQEEWTRTADRLGLTVRVQFPIDIAGRRFIAPVLLENFGLGDSNDRELTENLAGIIDMLRDWGWSGDGDPPSWYVDDAT
jgi:hypothetical protein